MHYQDIVGAGRTDKRRGVPVSLPNKNLIIHRKTQLLSTGIALLFIGRFFRTGKKRFKNNKMSETMPYTNPTELYIRQVNTAV